MTRVATFTGMSLSVQDPKSVCSISEQSNHSVTASRRNACKWYPPADAYKMADIMPWLADQPKHGLMLCCDWFSRMTIPQSFALELKSDSVAQIGPPS